MSKTEDPLMTYKGKRDFSVTSEPEGEIFTKGTHLSFSIQKHDARNLHYDLRLELDGVLKSWAVPKGPSLDPKQKRLAVSVEDHPLSYGEFEGIIPTGQYGAGSVIVWDHGTWDPIGDAKEGLAAGQLKFHLYGEKLQGAWVLIRLHDKKSDKQKNWLLIKERDAYVKAAAEFDVVASLPGSVLKKTDELIVPAGALLAPVPPALSPQLATLMEAIPSSGDWSYEVKLDGYRILAKIDENEVKLFTRNGLNWTAKLEGIALALKELKIAPGWLDGEIVSLGVDGLPDFESLQNSFDSKNTKGIRYYIFDMPYYAGFDLRNTALSERRNLLEKILSKSTSAQVSFSTDFKASGKDIVSSACRLGLEGIMGKRKDSFYVSGRSPDWIKLKCAMRQEFVVVGYTESKGGDRNIGALLLAVYDQAGHLVYAGKVGTGFDSASDKMLKGKLEPLAVEETPLFEKPKDAIGNWVRPELVCEISFISWTKAGRVRHGVFHGLRSDKAPNLIFREVPNREETNREVTNREVPNKEVSNDVTIKSKTEASDSNPKISESKISNPKISNPSRIIDSSTGIMKSDILAYYELAGKWILPYLLDRPVTFLRAPSGIGGPMFFQKHADALKSHKLKQLEPELEPEHAPLLKIDSISALIGAVQMNAIEFHVGNASIMNPAMPDRMVFDLDPGAGIEWTMMREAATLTRTLLSELSLISFLKTSGGKGLHIVVPLQPQDDWDTVKDFSKSVAHHLASVIPSIFTDISGPANRVGKIFIDYIRNNRSATTVSAFSLRARQGLGVSIPCSWEELPTLTGGAHFNISNVRSRLEFQENLWEDYNTTKQIINAEAKKTLLDR